MGKKRRRWATNEKTSLADEKAKENEANQARINRLVDAGICIRCGKKHDKGTHRCPECTKKDVAGNKKRKEQVATSGKCVGCGIPWNGETLRCDACKEKERNKWKDRTLTEFCSRCSLPKEDPEYKACEACRAAMRETLDKKRTLLIGEGKCVQCKSPQDTKGILCSRCLLKSHARRWLDNADLWCDLLAIFERQEGKCAYTGEQIIIGDNASLDHKIPRARGGPNSLENLHWVTWNVNQRKGDFTHEEFIALCKLIASRFE